jgi:hypothetical protein
VLVKGVDRTVEKQAGLALLSKFLPLTGKGTSWILDRR